VSMSPQGRRAFDAYVAYLQEIIGAS